MPEPLDLTPSQLADFDQSHAAAQADLDNLIESHHTEVARHGELLAAGRLMLRLAEQPCDVAAGFAALAAARLVRLAVALATVTGERDDLAQVLADMRPAAYPTGEVRP